MEHDEWEGKEIKYWNWNDELDFGGIKCQILRNYHEMKLLNSGEMLKLGPQGM